MEEMDCEEVALWLRKLGLGAETEGIVRKEQVDGDVLLALVAEQEGLAELKINSALGRAKVAGGLAKLSRAQQVAVGNAVAVPPLVSEEENGRGRAIREQLRAENEALKAKLECLA
eukprot:SAG31_NODE_21435_length_549_cov_1.988889_1_plen_116_part_00